MESRDAYIIILLLITAFVWPGLAFFGFMLWAVRKASLIPDNMKVSDLFKKKDETH